MPLPFCCLIQIQNTHRPNSPPSKHTNPTKPTNKNRGDYVSTANEHVVTAIHHAKRSRKYMCCLLLLVMALVVGAVLVLFVFKKGRKILG
jgi:uncharacterized protein HemX